jgi:2-polyprenyl-3-methyl-5-hydroxy-6-metoxy-1,4-benzoquinol methylase
MEATLAKWRANRANSLIRPEQRKGKILDVGCGSYPYFLMSTTFAEKFGLDKMVTPEVAASLKDQAKLGSYESYERSQLPFETGTFDVVTMLAVFEHIKVDTLIWLITDIHRVLKPGGSYIMTTPSGISGPVLALMKRVGAVSREEIDEHEDSYSPKKILAIMSKTPFESSKIRIGHFELGMNVWMCAGR